MKLAMLSNTKSEVYVTPTELATELMEAGIHFTKVEEGLDMSDILERDNAKAEKEAQRRKA